jgi:hypothetical protein
LKEENKAFKAQMKEKWEISERDASFIISIHIKRNLGNRTISLSQTALIDSILEEFCLADSHLAKLAMDMGLCLKHPKEPSNENTDKPYNSIISKMMYIACATHPDLAGPL